MNQVNGASRTLTLELLAVGDGLSGRAISDDGAAREFSGRIGLMHAIDERISFRSIKPVVFFASHMRGEPNPQFFATGRWLGLPTTAKVERSYTPSISRPAVACENNGGADPGYQSTPPDCGAKTVKPWPVNLQYSRTKENGLLLSAGDGEDPFENCLGTMPMFPTLQVEESGHKGNYITADLSDIDGYVSTTCVPTHGAPLVFSTEEFHAAMLSAGRVGGAGQLMAASAISNVSLRPATAAAKLTVNCERTRLHGQDLRAPDGRRTWEMRRFGYG